MNKTLIKTLIALIIITLIVFCSLLLGLFIIEKGKVLYYREQMINFCNLSVSQTKMLSVAYSNWTFPNVEPCYKWRLSYDE